MRVDCFRENKKFFIIWYFFKKFLLNLKLKKKIKIDIVIVGNLLFPKLIRIREISPNIEYENKAETVSRLYILFSILKLFPLDKNGIADKNRSIYENIKFK